MGVSSQRLIIMVIMINLMIGAVSVIYHNPTSQDLSIFSTWTSDSDTISSDALSDDTRDSGNMNNNVLTESTAGNPLKITKIMWNVFVNAIVPYPIGVDSTSIETGLEKILLVLITLIRSWLLYLVIMEIIMIFKNKKNN